MFTVDTFMLKNEEYYVKINIFRYHSISFAMWNNCIEWIKKITLHPLLILQKKIKICLKTILNKVYFIKTLKY